MTIKGINDGHASREAQRRAKGFRGLFISAPASVHKFYAELAAELGVPMNALLVIDVQDAIRRRKQSAARSGGKRAASENQEEGNGEVLLR